MKQKQPTIVRDLVAATVDFLARYVELRNRTASLKGISPEKRKAAILMTLYPGVLSRLSEVAQLAGVPTGTLAVWKQRETFDAAYGEESLELGRFITSLIKGVIEGNAEIIALLRKRFKAAPSILDEHLDTYLVEILRALGGEVEEPFYELRHEISEIRFHALLSILHDNPRGVGKRGREIAQDAIETGFSMLLHPDTHADDRACIAENLKTWMLRLLEEK